MHKKQKNNAGQQKIYSLLSTITGADIDTEIVCWKSVNQNVTNLNKVISFLQKNKLP